MDQTPITDEDEDLGGWIALEAATKNIVVLLQLKRGAAPAGTGAGGASAASPLVTAAKMDEVMLSPTKTGQQQS